MLQIAQSDKEINSSVGLALVKGHLDANLACGCRTACLPPPPWRGSGPPASSAT